MKTNAVVAALLLANLAAFAFLHSRLETLERHIERRDSPGAGQTSSDAALQPATGVDGGLPAVVASDRHSPMLSRETAEADGSAAASAPAEDWAIADDIVVDGEGTGATEPNADLDEFKRLFADEYDDAVWTARVDDVLQRLAATGPALAGVSADSAQCRETICRLVLRHSDQDAFAAYVDALTMALKGDLSAQVMFDAPETVGGNARVDVYLIRE